MSKPRLFTLSITAFLVLLASVAVSGIAAGQASAYSPSQHRVIQFVASHTNTLAHVADTASTAASANANGNWVRANALVQHFSRDYVRVGRKWLALPSAGGATARLEHLYASLFGSVGTYAICVAKQVNGDDSWSNVAKGLRAYNRAVRSCAQVLSELKRLD